MVVADEYLTHVRDVVSVLCAEGNSLNLRTCKFCKDAAIYLGHIIHSERLAKKQVRVTALVEAKERCTKVELRSYFRLINVY